MPHLASYARTRSFPSPSTPYLSRPRVIPPFPRRRLRLDPRILNRHPFENAILHHCNAVQPAHLLGIAPLRILPELGPLLRRQPLVIDQTQRFAGGGHAIVLALQLEFALFAALVDIAVPGAVDGPVAEEAGAGEAEGPRGEGVLEVVADVCWAMVVSMEGMW